MGADAVRMKKYRGCRQLVVNSSTTYYLLDLLSEHKTGTGSYCCSVPVAGQTLPASVNICAGAACPVLDTGICYPVPVRDLDSNGLRLVILANTKTAMTSGAYHSLDLFALAEQNDTCGHNHNG
jgi:hypothetical protein